MKGMMGKGAGPMDWAGGKGRQDWQYTPTTLGEDRIPAAAQRLYDFRRSLKDDAAKAYEAVQIALKRCRSKPSFDQDFHEALGMLFRDRQVNARQIGGMNQWEVKIDGGPAIYCSVRLEVLSDDPTKFLNDVKNKARTMKDVLLEDGARWKQILTSPNGGTSRQLQAFERECADRLQDGSYRGSSDRQTGRGQWQEARGPGETCLTCNRGLDEDILDGTHMCVVCVTFKCGGCGGTWTSHHGRMGPDESIIGQACQRCRCMGEMMEWHLNDRNEMRERQEGAGPRKMHQSDLCEACHKYGNCMGVFYEPFLLQAALSAVCHSEVQWKLYSQDIPELLVADLGRDFQWVQVCLQPHVYTAEGRNQGYEDSSDEEDYNLSSYERALRGAGGRRMPYGQQQQRPPMHVPRNPRGAGGPSAAARRRQVGDVDDDEEYWGVTGPIAQQRGGVKDTALFGKFLARGEGSGLAPPPLRNPGAPPGMAGGKGKGGKGDRGKGDRGKGDRGPRGVPSREPSRTPSPPPRTCAAEPPLPPYGGGGGGGFQSALNGGFQSGMGAGSPYAQADAYGGYQQQQQQQQMPQPPIPQQLQAQQLPQPPHPQQLQAAAPSQMPLGGLHPAGQGLALPVSMQGTVPGMQGSMPGSIQSSQTSGGNLVIAPPPPLGEPPIQVPTQPVPAGPVQAASSTKRANKIQRSQAEAIVEA